MRVRGLFQSSTIFLGGLRLMRLSRAFCPNSSLMSAQRTTLRALSAVTSKSEEKLVDHMLYRIRQVNKSPEDVVLTDFSVDGSSLGKVTPTMLDTLLETNAFEMQGDSLTLSAEAGTTCESRTEAVQTVMRDLREQGIIRAWRDEMYPVGDSFYKDPVFLMERAAVGVIGALEYGVHLNGLVQKEDGEVMMWIARRSAQKPTYPGMLDHMVAGGQPAGMTLIDNVVKECEEEAGVPEDVAKAGIKPAGAISYESLKKDRINRAVLFCYDLWLPEDFQPKPVDDEVDEFFLWTMDQVKESFDPAFSDPIKPNCYVVLIDYLLRSGQISPDTPRYLDVLRELRSAGLS
jgi:isopentenyldiphosphate isomerase